MVSFSSSVVKKGSKKFAPRAPSRRAPVFQHPSITTQASTGPVNQQSPQTTAPASQSPITPALAPPVEDDVASTSTLTVVEPAVPPEQPSTLISPPQDNATPISHPVSIIQTPAASISLPQPAPTPISVPKPRPVLVPTPVQIPPSSRPSSVQVAAALSIPSPAPPSFTQPATIAPSAGTDEFPIERPAKRVRVSEPQTTELIPQPVSQPQPVPTQDAASIRPPQPRRAAAKRTSTDKPPSTEKTRKIPAQTRRSATTNAEGRSSTTPRTRRKRASTPEDAANVEVEPGVIKMSELCKDLKTGKKSRRETELQRMDRRKREGASGEGNDVDSTAPKPPPPDSSTASQSKPPVASAPQMRVVNGQIVIDSDSLQIDRYADAARDMEELEEVVENDLTRRINYASFGKRTKAESWDEDLTNFFYRGLRMFGTDFMMISKMFPGRNRRQIKLKFCNEERKNPVRIRETLLGPREPVSLEDYSVMTSTTYDDPAIVQKELDDEKRRIEEEHAKEKQAREENLRNSGADQPLPSVEKGFKARLGARRNAAFSASAGQSGAEEILGTID
ncbi:hypothetical protein KEM56_002883 [Ascosphaera pollenicola]|nr:hypothetical protein KEM56_002883 [Ascosphaera pollenicola]